MSNKIAASPGCRGAVCQRNGVDHCYGRINMKNDEPHPVQLSEIGYSFTADARFASTPERIEAKEERLSLAVIHNCSLCSIRFDIPGRKTAVILGGADSYCGRPEHNMEVCEAEGCPTFLRETDWPEEEDDDGGAATGSQAALPGPGVPPQQPGGANTNNVPSSSSSNRIPGPSSTASARIPGVSSASANGTGGQVDLTPNGQTVNRGRTTVNPNDTEDDPTHQGRSNNGVNARVGIIIGAVLLILTMVGVSIYLIRRLRQQKRNVLNFGVSDFGTSRNEKMGTHSSIVNNMNGSGEPGSRAPTPVSILVKQLTVGYQHPSSTMSSTRTTSSKQPSTMSIRNGPTLTIDPNFSWSNPLALDQSNPPMPKAINATNVPDSSSTIRSSQLAVPSSVTPSSFNLSSPADSARSSVVVLKAVQTTSREFEVASVNADMDERQNVADTIVRSVDERDMNSCVL
ncbi:hypothetical protein HK102_008345 [Quaeritorhiza haematococci]|nr:hypothetical protein HK102_008345 [Quaeritorhiza haematococci]